MESLFRGKHRFPDLCANITVSSCLERIEVYLFFYHFSVKFIIRLVCNEVKQFSYFFFPLAEDCMKFRAENLRLRAFQFDGNLFHFPSLLSHSPE